MTKSRMALGCIVAGMVVALASCGTMSPSTSTTASSKVTTLTARLTGASEVPPVTTPGSGMLTASYEEGTKTLLWSATYSGLTGPVTGAHFHGPAAAGANAPVVVPFAQVTSPIQGTAKLTDAQAADLLAGRWYVNIHTAAHPGGEIRGQLAPL